MAKKKIFLSTIISSFFPLAMPTIALYVGYRVYWRDGHVDTFEHLVVVSTQVLVAFMAFWSWWEAGRKSRLAVLKKKAFSECPAPGQHCDKCDCKKIAAFRPQVGPVLVHHCSQCGHCILGMDHHCAFTDNCICGGPGGTMKPFFLFTAFTGL